MPVCNRFQLLLCVLFLSGACQRELSFEKYAVSEGTLKKDAAGNCDSIRVSGTLIASQPVADSNWIGVIVNVSKKGSWHIASDTINGYSFQGDGEFSSTGTFFVKLIGTGVPLTHGINHFTVRYGNSNCAVAIPVNKDLATPATITLVGAPVNCMDPQLSGFYVAGFAMDSTSTVSLKVMVVEPGTFEIGTATVNGYQFNGTGVFTQTGVQQVVLYATGKPVTAGIDIFTASIGSSECSFPVECLAPVNTTGSDHFPLSQGSRWVYDYLYFPGDSLVRTIDGTADQENISYTVMKEKKPSGTVKDFFFRKDGNQYTEFGSLDKYSSSFSFIPGSVGIMPVMREALVTGSSWQSPYYAKTSAFGDIVQVHYEYYCVNGNAGVVVNGTAFGNVYKILMYVTVGSASNAGGYSGEVEEYWYAKGIGLVYAKKMTGKTVNFEQKIRRWQVNLNRNSVLKFPP